MLQQCVSAPRRSGARAGIRLCEDDACMSAYESQTTKASR
jgi:hypothetical protein